MFAFVTNSFSWFQVHIYYLNVTVWLQLLLRDEHLSDQLYKIQLIWITWTQNIHNLNNLNCINTKYSKFRSVSHLKVADLRLCLWSVAHRTLLTRFWAGSSDIGSLISSRYYLQPGSAWIDYWDHFSKISCASKKSGFSLTVSPATYIKKSLCTWRNWKEGNLFRMQGASSLET